MPREPHHRTHPTRTRRARTLRHDSSKPETRLWQSLRNRRLAGLKFRRQETFGPFVVDFFCPDARLVVELDGLSHVGRGEADDARTAYLESLGLKVYRVTIDDLLEHEEAVLVGIARAAGVKW